MRRYARMAWRRTFGGGMFKRRDRNSWRTFRGLPERLSLWGETTY